MSHNYSKSIAQHYAAYRPPLHEVILTSFLNAKNRFDKGLDIGCGNGYSSIALAKWCDQVYGIEVSQKMLETAKKHPKVHYQFNEALPYPFEANEFDVITFAGSLFYAKTPSLIEELFRVAGPNCRIFVYDFDIQLVQITNQLPFSFSIPETNYDHQVDFSDIESLYLHKTLHSTYALKVKTADLAHLLLAEHELNEQLYSLANIGDPHPYLIELLDSIFEPGFQEIPVNLYGKEYQI